MKPFKTLSYQDLLGEQHELHVENGMSTKIAAHPLWGKWEHKSIEFQHFTINTYKASLKESLTIQFEDPTLSKRMNVCMAVDGHTATYSKLNSWLLPLSTRNYHQVFLNDTNFDFQVSRDCTNVHIQIDVEYFINLLCESDPWMHDLKTKLIKGENTVTSNALITADMIHLIRGVVNNPLNGQFKKLFVEAKIIELLTLQFLKLSEGNRETVSCKNRDREVFYAMRDYLYVHFADDLSLQQLSKQFGINEFKLKKGFKEIFHSTVFDFIHELRMEQAYELINNENFLIHEVSSKVGYKSANHFATAFKKRFGKSPSAF